MKFLIVFLSLFIPFLSLAYEPTTGDLQIIADYKGKIDSIKSKNALRLLDIKDTLQGYISKNLENERFSYILGVFDNYVSQVYQSDLASYFQSVSEDFPQRCFEHFDEVDAIAKQNDFPASLILAMRYKEHHCFYDNPSNGRGLFQISSQNYGTGDLTRDAFSQQVNDFIQFGRGKINAYNQNKKFGTGDINISYQMFDSDSIRIFAYIYRGYKKAETPRDSKFVNGNISEDLFANEDGAFTLFVKFIRRLTQKG